jgi:hypothetical protein
MTEKTYQCRKCGADLNPKQKVCPQCGEITPAGGKFDVPEEVAWRPSPLAIKLATAVVVLLIAIPVLYSLFHVTPPEVVAKQWFAAMSGRSLGVAGKMVTPRLQQSLASEMSSLQALSDEWNTETYTNRATYTVSKPTYTDRTHADVRISLIYPDKQPGPEVNLRMVRQGKRWLVDQVM